MVGEYRQRLSAVMEPGKRVGELPSGLDEAAAVPFLGTVRGLVVQGTLFGGESGLPAPRLWPLMLHGFCGLRP